jgi:hypothetical protein
MAGIVSPLSSPGSPPAQWPVAATATPRGGPQTPPPLSKKRGKRHTSLFVLLAQTRYRIARRAWSERRAWKDRLFSYGQLSGYCCRKSRKCPRPLYRPFVRDRRAS